MASIRQLEGVKEVLLNLKIRNEKLAAGCSRGLRLAGLTLQRESQRLVPVDLGNLKASSFTRAKGSGLGTEVIVGYTASYALFVHELVGMVLKGKVRRGPGAKGRYWDPSGRGQAKFLEEPARRLAPELVKIIKSNMEIT